MATTDVDLIAEVRVITGHGTLTLDDTEYQAVVSMAKRHIRTRKGIVQSWSESDWYAEDAREEALFWFTALFSKVATGELDAQTLQVGAVDARELLAKGNHQVTTWYRNAEQALGHVEPGKDAGTTMRHAQVTREDRLYGEDDESTGDISL